ncbi:hypothetical protein BH11GEM2_BH11GEM2_41410 [soil metagenome]
MSSMHRTISGSVIVQHLGPDAMRIDQDLVARHGRSARTLVKEGALRLTMMALAAGGGLPPHSTDNPISIQVLDGDVIFYALDQQFALGAGDVLILAARVEHAAQSVHGARFLLTVAHTSPAGDPSDAMPAEAMGHPLSESARERWLDDGGAPRPSADPVDPQRVS